MKLNFMAEVEGGVDKMKDVTVAHLYIDTAYGREPLPAMRIIAENWGFRLLEIPIAAPGLEQQSQWRRVRREDVDWVPFWGAGAGMRGRSEEHTSELQSLIRTTYAVLCLEHKTYTDNRLHKQQ